MNIFLLPYTIGMAGTPGLGSVIGASRVMIANEDGNGSAQRKTVEYATENLGPVTFRSFAADNRLCGFSPAQGIRNNLVRQCYSGGTAIDNRSDSRTVAFSEGSQDELVSETVATHG
jgi:hypothetical protein